MSSKAIRRYLIANPKVNLLVHLLPPKRFFIIILPYVWTLLIPSFVFINNGVLLFCIDLLPVAYLTHLLNLLPNILCIQLLTSVDWLASSIIDDYIRYLLYYEISYRLTPHLILEQVYTKLVDVFTLVTSATHLVNTPNYGLTVLSTLLNIYEGSFLVIDFTTTRTAIVSFSIKFILIILLLIFVRGGIPRYRFDFLTKMGWFKYFSWVLLFFLTTYFFYLLFS